MAKQPPARQAMLSKQEAADAQLSTALGLWFHYAPPVAIHALANGAFECYEALASNSAKPSSYKEWLGKQSQGFQDRVRDMTNFIKHGRRKLTGQILFMPIVAETMMTDSIESFEHLHGKKTPLMTLFLARWVIENPTPANAPIRPIILRAAKADDLADRNRTEFLYEGLKRLSAGDQ